MSTTAPQTPENTPRKIALNRSFTLPAKIAATSRTNPTAEIGATEGVETLYIHPNGKIVKFTSASTSRPGSSAGAPSPGSQQGQGTLPWATLTEQTLAAGPLEIYRVPGTVSFLHSGSLLHAILPRSNCWCVDGVSKFAMRVLANTYYRIELPGETPEDLAKAEEFKETLKRVLFYERTACPFARTFTVDLPEEPQARKKKRRYHGPAKKWKLDKAYSWRPEDGREPLQGDTETSSGSLSASEEEGSSSAGEQSDSSEVTDQLKEMKVVSPSRPTVRERARGLNLRSVTSPPQMSIHSTPPSRLRTSIVAEGQTDNARNESRASDLASGTLDEIALRPFQAIPTDMPPSPPDSSAGYELSDAVPQPIVPRWNDDIAPESTITSDESIIMSVPSPGLHMDLDQSDQPAEHEAESATQTSLPLSSQWDGQPADGPDDEAAARTPPIAHHIGSSPPPQPLSVTDDDDQEHEVLEQSHHSSNELDARDPTAPLPELDEAAVPEIPSSSPDEDTDCVTGGIAAPDSQDPFAQIQARIQARRSIGGTTSFQPSSKSATRQSSSSTASSSTASLTSTRSRRSPPLHQQQQAFATALVLKACAVFLGPPAHLVAIMLRIAARFAKGAFPSAHLFDSPEGFAKRIPGSFDLDGSDVEDFDLDIDGLDWEEDDFGVPLRSPIRLSSVTNRSLSRTVSRESAVSTAVREHVRERTGWKEASPEL